LKTSLPVDAAEVRTLSRKYGVPQLAELKLDKWPMPGRARDERRGEVVFAIRNRRGEIILHTKTFYPEGVYRLPGGGIRWDEEVENALFREIEEETGLPVTVEKFVALILYEVRRRKKPFASYVFLLSTDKLHPSVQDPGERISAFKGVSAAELRAITQLLRTLPDEWRTWGKFRALAHELVADAMGE
jgi:ADP-ribose pyrophosphatase YjhB (NUDIX family)